MIAIPRDLLFHMGIMFGDYVRIVANDDGSITVRNGENFNNLSDPPLPTVASAIGGKA